MTRTRSVFCRRAPDQRPRLSLHLEQLPNLPIRPDETHRRPIARSSSIADSMASAGSAGFNRSSAARSFGMRTTSDFVSRPNQPPRPLGEGWGEGSAEPNDSSVAETVAQASSAKRSTAGCSTSTLRCSRLGSFDGHRTLGIWNGRSRLYQSSANAIRCSLGSMKLPLTK